MWMYVREIYISNIRKIDFEKIARKWINNYYNNGL